MNRIFVCLAAEAVLALTILLQRSLRSYLEKRCPRS